MSADPITAVATALSDALHTQQQLQTEKNTPAEIAAKTAQAAVNTTDEITKDVAAENTLAVEKDIAG